MENLSYQRLTKKRYHFLGVTLLVVAVVFFLLGEALRLDHAKLIENFTKYHLVLLVPATFCVLSQVFFRTVRLWILFPRPAAMSWVKAARAYAYGQFLNTLIPARAGEIVKGVYLTRKNSSDGRDIHLTETLGLLTADRIADAVSFLLLILTAMFLNSKHFVDWANHQSAWPYVFVGISVLSIATVTTFIARRRFPRLMHGLQNFLRGLGALRNTKRVFACVLMATGAWFSEMGAMHILCSAQGVTLSFDQMVWVLVVLNVGIAIPLSFANLGTFEALMTIALVQLGVPLAAALSIATVHHVLQVLGVALWAMGMWTGQKIKGVLVEDSSGYIPQS